MKHLLVQALEANIPDTIKRQGKNILICEIVRMLMSESITLGYRFFPPRTTRREQRNQEFYLVRVLQDKYAEYKGPYASIKNIVSDLIDEATKIGVSILPL